MSGVGEQHHEPKTPDLKRAPNSFRARQRLTSRQPLAPWAEEGREMTTETTLRLVRAYYDSWQEGGERFDEAQLRSVLHPQLNFESPMGAETELDNFLQRLRRFTPSLKRLHMLQLFAAGSEAAALYDCELLPPVCNLRCTEIFRVAGERITSLHLVFDATPFKQPRG